MNTMKDYHDLYLKVDVLLLACAFETFRKESINHLKLDHAYYLYTPGNIWNAMLRFTNISLKLILDIEKYQYIESTIRGGIYNFLGQGYAEPINKLLKPYNANKPGSFILYLDANNSYRHSMMQLLPTGIFD